MTTKIVVSFPNEGVYIFDDLQDAFDNVRAEGENPEDCEFYELGPKFEVEVKIQRKQVLKKVSPK